MTTYYVSSSGGTGVGSVGDPWSFAHAMDTGSSGFAAGDYLYIMDDGVYNVGSALTITVVGSSSAPTVMIGANSSGVIDGSRPVFRATAAFSGAMCATANAFNTIALIDFDADGNTDYAVSGGASKCFFYSCIFRNGIDWGFYSGGTNDAQEVHYCLAHNNGTSGSGGGFMLVNNINGNSVAYKCIARDNSGDGFAGDGATAIACVSLDNWGGYRTQAVDSISHSCSGDSFRGGSIAANCISTENGRSYRGTVTLFSGRGSGALADLNTATYTAQGSIPSMLDTGADSYTDLLSSPPDWRIPNGATVNGIGMPWAESIFGAVADTSLGVSDYETPAGGGGGGSLGGSPLSSPFLRV